MQDDLPMDRVLFFWYWFLGGSVRTDKKYSTIHLVEKLKVSFLKRYTIHLKEN